MKNDLLAMKKENLIKSIIFIIEIIIILSSCTFGDKKRTYQESYRGLIIKNYRDYHNHGMYTFDVKNNDYEFKVLSEAWPCSWEYAKVGDSVIKLPDTLILIIKKPNGEEKHFNYDW